jgi:hypothetical protein
VDHARAATGGDDVSAPDIAPPVAVWFEARGAYLCACQCEIDPGDLAAWLPGGDDGDGSVACLTCGEAAEQESAAA